MKLFIRNDQNRQIYRNGKQIRISHSWEEGELRWAVNSYKVLFWGKKNQVSGDGCTIGHILKKKIPLSTFKMINFMSYEVFCSVNCISIFLINNNNNNKKLKTLLLPQLSAFASYVVKIQRCCLKVKRTGNAQSTLISITVFLSTLSPKPHRQVKTTSGKHADSR